MSPPTINESEIIKKLTVYFDSNGWPYDLDHNKLMTRYSVSLDESEPGFAIVKIERHRAICGTTYKKGVPMSAMETYWMRYAIDLSNSEVKELNEISEKITIDIQGFVLEQLDTDGFELYIEPVDEKHYRIIDFVCGVKKIITTFDDAKVFVLGFVDGFVEHFEFHLDLHPIEDSQKFKYITDYKITLEEALDEKVKELWDQKESWEEFMGL